MNPADLTYNGTYFRTSLDNKGVLSLYLYGEKLLHSTMFQARDELLSYLQTISHSKAVEIVLFFCNTPSHQKEEYYRFYKTLLHSSSILDDALWIYRALDQLILEIVKSDRYFISVCKEPTIPLFFNLSLACDYRIVSEKWALHKTYHSLGLIPKGGTLYFLKHLIGPHLSRNIIISPDILTAEEAYHLNIVDDVVPVQDIEQKSFQIAHDMVERTSLPLGCVKELQNYALKDLENYLERENSRLTHILTRHTKWREEVKKLSTRQEE